MPKETVGCCIWGEGESWLLGRLARNKSCVQTGPGSAAASFERALLPFSTEWNVLSSILGSSALPLCKRIVPAGPADCLRHPQRSEEEPPPPTSCVQLCLNCTRQWGWARVYRMGSHRCGYRKFSSLLGKGFPGGRLGGVPTLL